MANDTTRSVHAAPNWTIDQNSASYIAAHHATWGQMFARQAAKLPTRGAAPVVSCASGRIMHADTQAYVRGQART